MRTLFFCFVFSFSCLAESSHPTSTICVEGELHYQKPDSKKHKPIGAILSLVSSAPEKSSMGTGTIIGKDLILTAGHVIENYLTAVEDGYSAELYFSPEGYSTKDSRSKFIKIIAYQMGNKDWALVKTATPLDKSYGSHSLKSVRPEKLIKDLSNIELSGYPSSCYDSKEASVPLAISRCNIFKQQPYWTSLGKGFLRAGCRGAGGMSGGPVFFNNDSGDKIIGILVGISSAYDGEAYLLPSSEIQKEMKDLKKYPWRKIK